jgi:hypothetical protein
VIRIDLPRLPYIVCLIALFPVTAAAQYDVDIERFTPSLDPEGFVGVQGTRTPGSEMCTVGWFFSYAYDPLLVGTRDRDDVSIVQHRLAADLSAQIGIGGRAAFGAGLPMVLVQTGQSAFPDDPSLPVFAVGDPRLQARYRLVGDDADEQSEHHDGPGMALQLGAALPAGRRDSLTGEGALRTHLQLLGDFQLLGAGVGASLGWLHRVKPRELLDSARFRDEVSFALGLKMPLPWFPDVAAVLEVRGSTDAGAPFSDRATTPLEGDLGARIALGDVTLVAAAGTAFTGGAGSPTVRGIVGLWWAPRPSDADGDGIDDGDDQCPPLAEDLDGFQDQDGCPDPDNDGDWIPDADDLCPDTAPEEGRDLDEDGCQDN